MSVVGDTAAVGVRILRPGGEISAQASAAECALGLLEVELSFE
jgi:hypothetical protein